MSIEASKKSIIKIVDAFTLMGKDEICWAVPLN